MKGKSKTPVVTGSATCYNRHMETMMTTDLVKKYIDAACIRVDPDRPSRRQFDMKKLFELAELNGFRTSRFKKAIDSPFSRGRVRMNIGNLLRGKVARDGFLNTLDGQRISDLHDLT